jgi:hypothetical protein
MEANGKGTLILAASLVVLSGCEDTEIRRYRVPKTREARAAVMPPPGHVGAARPGALQRRMLAAIVPRGQRVWFFKLVGPAEIVKPEKEAFVRFLNSLRFKTQADGSVPEWTVPKHWRQTPGSGMRYATFLLGPEKSKLQLTVIPLVRRARAVLPNVNRWRRELGLGPIVEAELGQSTQSLQIDGQSATLVDLEGPAAPRHDSAGASPAPRLPPEGR